MMTRKDYELIAGAISRTRMASGILKKDTIANRTARDGALQGLKLLAIDLAATLAHDNPRFDVDRFLKAAGVDR